ncbi:cell wall protein Ecm33 [Entomophthora muscae]|uniref:Cell wall protein Ecm33 n=1 Tax=Entomophthora muscae TaxID=34485 RepID=A0ACC2RR31_9FUNG|nr:cell wall protein Ecm33 [Entomophthora muscae]
MKFYIGLVYGLQIGAAVADICSKNQSLTRVDELLRIKNCTNLKGALIFSFRDPVSIVLSRLKEAHDLTIHGAGVTEVKFDGLRSVGRLSVVDTSGLTLIRMPRLKKADFLSVENARSLHFLEFRSGLDIVGDLTLKNTSLQAIQDIHAKVIASIVLENNPNLLKMPLPYLQKVNRAFIVKAPNEKFVLNAPALEEVFGGVTYERGGRIEMPKLHIIHGNLRLLRLNAIGIDLPVKQVKGSLEVIDCHNLILLTLPRLVRVEGWLYIFRDYALESIRLRSLESIGGNIHVYALNAYDIHLNRLLTGPKKTTIVAKVICTRIYKVFGPQLKSLTCVSSATAYESSGMFLSLF